MKTFQVKIKIKAKCPDDAIKLLESCTNKKDLTILTIKDISLIEGEQNAFSGIRP